MCDKRRLRRFYLFIFCVAARSLHRGTHSSQSNRLTGGEAGPGERGWARIRRGREKAREWKGAHEESCLLQLHRWRSRWDGSDGWIDKERGWDWGEREKWHESTRLTVYIRSTGLENFQGKHFNIYCSVGWSETFFSSSPIRQREKWPRSRLWNINSVAETRDAER